MPARVLADLGLVTRLQEWVAVIQRSLDSDSLFLQRARTYASASVRGARHRAHSAVTNLLAGGVQQFVGVDLELHAPTIVIPFSTSEHGSSARNGRTNVRCHGERGDAAAVLQLGVFRCTSDHALAGCRYEASLSGVGATLREAADRGWCGEQGEGVEPALLSPASLALAFRVADPDAAGLPLVRIEGSVSALEVGGSEEKASSSLSGPAP